MKGNEIRQMNRTNPLYVVQPSLPPFDEYVKEISSIWSSRWLTNVGDKHRALEQLLKEYLRVEELELFCNGHLALESIIRACKLKGEIITTAFSHASTTHAIERSGLKPVFCDIKLPGCTMDPELIEDLITEETSALLPVHVYGNPCEVEKIQAIADRHGLVVIYDAAHAFGVELEGASLASFGDASMISFHATKAFSTVEGGVICCKDPAITKELKLQNVFGMAGPEKVVSVGGNARMDEFSASMGICNLRHFDQEVDTRRNLAAIYFEELAAIPGVTTFLEREVTGVYKSNFSYMPVLVDCLEYGRMRDQLNDYLASHQIYPRKYFYPSINDFECYRNSVGRDVSVPLSQLAASQVLTLPLHCGMSKDDVLIVCELIRSFGKAS
ncbi:MAG: DegT/DnrJ/EryC1/StrS family aminotransferase [Coriobacteriia bacterium]|nr:DegT/DnrJ/EryC1/StrS family aminotransferase [Coriobacteriia bacterium]